VGVESFSEKTQQRVEDHQGNILVEDGLFQQAQVGGQTENAFPALVFDGVEAADT